MLGDYRAVVLVGLMVDVTVAMKVVKKVVTKANWTVDVTVVRMG